jgi:hypothetical protein
MPYIDRDQSGNIVGIYANQQREGQHFVESAELWINAHDVKAVTMRQARKALLRSGKLGLVETAIASMTGQAGEEARIEWEYSNEVLRNQPLTVALAQIIGLNEQEMDDLFTTASTL